MLKKSKAYVSTTVDQFFSPNESRDPPKAVILEGESGYGKSFMLQKIRFDWASGNLYQDKFDLVLHLDCKTLNTIKPTEKRSVLDLVSYHSKYTPLIEQKLKESPQKVLFLIDGFDGYTKLQKSEINSSSVKDPFTPAPVAEVVSSLLKGHILEDCFLLVTTRAAASDQLNKMLKSPKHSNETNGFSEKGIKQYFEKFCQDEHVSKKAFETVKENDTLFTSCSVPFISWIVCTVFKAKESEAEAETTTYIFLEYVNTVLHKLEPKRRTPLLRSLGELAENGIKKKEYTFDKKTVEKVLDPPSDSAEIPFLHKFHQTKGTRKKEMFHFMHQRFQEFFAALYYIIDYSDDKVNALLPSLEAQSLKSSTISVIKFLFGLSNKDSIKDLEDDLDLIYNHAIQKQLDEWMLRVIQKSKNSKGENMALLILHCLYERHEEKFVKRAMGLCDEISFESIPLSKTDCQVLAYCLKHSTTVKSLALSECDITAEKLRMLQPTMRKCEKLG